MSSYVNAKAITLISLFVWFCSSIKVKNKSMGHSQTFKYSHKSLGLLVGLRTGLEEHNLTFGATLIKWLAEKLGHPEIQLDFTQE